MSKKWFTTIELLIVIILISVLLVTFSGIFQLKNKDNLYWQVCVNNLYGNISDFFFAGLTSKSIFSGSEKIFPSIYYVDFNIPDNEIILKYQNSGTIQNSRVYQLSWNISASYYCMTNSYQIILSWSSTTIKINKWLSQDENLQTLTLSWSASDFTWEVNFMQCGNDNTPCKELWKIEMDTRTQNIKKKICLNINGSWSCQEWDN